MRILFEKLMKPQYLSSIKVSEIYAKDNEISKHEKANTGPFFSQKKIFYYWTMLYMCTLGNALYAQHISGVVYALGSSATKIENATLRLYSKTFSLATSSDSLGQFHFSAVPPGRYSLDVSHVLCYIKTIDEILVKTGTSTSLYIELVEKQRILDELKIVRLSDNDVGLKELKTERISRFAGTWEDPLRMVLSLPGVSSVNDRTNEIVVRGNSPKGLLWRIEGIEVVNPNHFGADGATGGSISALSTYTMENSTFYTGGFPAHVGNATSGVMDVKLRNGSSDSRRNRLTLSVLGGEIGTEGPIRSEKSSYLIHYKYANTFLLKKMGIVNALDAINPKFQDITFKIFSRHNRATRTLWGLGGINETVYSIAQFKEVTNKSSFLALGLKEFRAITQKISLENHLSVSSQKLQNSELDLSQIKNNRDFSLSYPSVRLSSQLNVSLTQNDMINAGGIVSILGYNSYGKLSYSYPGIPEITDFSIDSKGKTYFAQAFVNNKWTKGKFTTFAGIHYSYFFFTGKSTLEPRLKLIYASSPNSSLGVAIGKHSKLEPISLYLYKNDQNINGKAVRNDKLDISKAWHFNLDYTQLFNNRAKLIASAYIQHLYDYPFTDTNQHLNEQYVSFINELSAINLTPLVSTGTGRNLGAELSYETPLIRGTYVLSTLSIFKSEFDLPNERGLSSRFNNNLVCNLLAGKEFQINRHLLNINFRGVFAKGKRIPPFEVNNGVLVYDYSKGYTNRLRNYFKIDFKFNFVQNLGKSSITYSLDLNNLLNRQNPYFLIYNPVKKEIQEINQMGFLPVLMLHWEW